MTRMTKQDRERVMADLARRKQLIIEDLRDQCIGLLKDSNMTQRQVFENGGPTPQTIKKWTYRETRSPQLATVSTFLNALGYDLAVVAKDITKPGRD